MRWIEDLEGVKEGVFGGKKGDDAERKGGLKKHPKASKSIEE